MIKKISFIFLIVYNKRKEGDFNGYSDFKNIKVFKWMLR